MGSRLNYLDTHSSGQRRQIRCCTRTHKFKTHTHTQCLEAQPVCLATPLSAFLHLSSMLSLSPTIFLVLISFCFYLPIRSFLFPPRSFLTTKTVSSVLWQSLSTAVLLLSLCPFISCHPSLPHFLSTFRSFELPVVKSLHLFHSLPHSFAPHLFAQLSACLQRSLFPSHQQYIVWCTQGRVCDFQKPNQQVQLLAENKARRGAQAQGLASINETSHTYSHHYTPSAAGSLQSAQPRPMSSELNHM